MARSVDSHDGQDSGARRRVSDLLAVRGMPVIIKKATFLIITSLLLSWDDNMRKPQERDNRDEN